MNTKNYLILFTTIGILLSSCKKDSENDPATSTPNNKVSLLADAQTGTPFTTGVISDFTLASNNDNVALLISNNTTGKIYAIELDDNSSNDATANTISAPVTDFATKIASKMGIAINQVRVRNIEVNPISKAVYILATNSQGSAAAIFKATDGGSTIEQVVLSNVTYSEITYSTSGHRINDITWGDNTLFLSFNQAATLNGEVASIAAPFTNGATINSRATTVYKTNWGGGYHTDAPLETMTYAEVNGSKRLMGITVCAPGFSFETSEVTNGSSILEVKEYFNLNTLPALKVFTVQQGGQTFLVESHWNGRITRVGEKYIDGSQTEVNANAKYLLKDGGTNVVNGLTDTDVKIIAPASTYIIAAKYTNSKLLVVSTTGVLTTLDI